MKNTKKLIVLALVLILLLSSISIYAYAYESDNNYYTNNVNTFSDEPGKKDTNG